MRLCNWNSIEVQKLRPVSSWPPANSCILWQEGRMLINRTAYGGGEWEGCMDIQWQPSELERQYRGLLMHSLALSESADLTSNPAPPGYLISSIAQPSQACLTVSFLSQSLWRGPIFCSVTWKRYWCWLSKACAPNHQVSDAQGR